MVWADTFQLTARVMLATHWGSRVLESSLACNLYSRSCSRLWRKPFLKPPTKTPRNAWYCRCGYSIRLPVSVNICGAKMRGNTSSHNVFSTSCLRTPRARVNNILQAKLPCNNCFRLRVAFSVCEPRKTNW